MVMNTESDPTMPFYLKKQSQKNLTDEALIQRTDGCMDMLMRMTLHFLFNFFNTGMPYIKTFRHINHLL